MILSCLAVLLTLASAASFRGEDCASCHVSIRDRSPFSAKPAEAPERADVVVIGGGLAGLTAAYNLKDMSVVVLEKEDAGGGKTRRLEMGPWKRPTGAVYTVAPFGKLVKMYEELGLKPRKLKAPVHNMWTQDGVLVEWLSKETILKLARGPQERECLAKFSAYMSEFAQKEPVTIPMSDSDAAAVAELDAVSQHAHLTKRFCARAAEIGDWHARDVFGAGAKDYSAALGMLYLGEEDVEAYSWPGGLGEIADRMIEAIGPVLRTGAFVTEVSQDQDGVRVVYLQEGRRRELRAKTAVVAVPSMVGLRIIKGLSKEKRAAMERVRYSGYTTVALKFRKAVYKDSFVLWAPGLSFMDITFSGGERLEDFSETLDGQVAVAYLPVGPGARRKLLASTDKMIEKAVRADLEKVLPGAGKELEEVHVVRWGHAMPIMGPGYLTKIQPALRKPEGRLFFAGVDLEVPAVEGAMFSGMAAAEGARELVKR